MLYRVRITRFGKVGPMELERIKNELILSEMQKKRSNIGIYVPLITLVSGFLTFMVIISWTTFVMR